MFSTSGWACFSAVLRMGDGVIVTYSGNYHFYFLEEIVSIQVFLHRNFNGSFIL